jgi:rfaE bifunctional protein kinase chain/domain
MKDFSKLNILVCGEVCVDRYVDVIDNRVSPEAPVPIVTETTDSALERLGMSANVWNNLRSLGVDAQLRTVIGCSCPNRLDNLSGWKAVTDSSRMSASKTRLTQNGRHIVRYDQEDSHPLNEDISSKFLHMLKKELSQYNYHGVILQDYGKGIWTDQTLGFIKHCYTKGIPVFVDPYEGRPTSDYNGAHLIKPNYVEAMEMLSRNIHWNPEIPPSDKHVLTMLREESDATWIVLTAAERGMLAQHVDGVFTAKPTDTQLIDPTGAGDTALAVLTVMMLSGYDIQTSMEAANKAAGKVIQQLGVGTVTIHDIKEFLD